MSPRILVIASSIVTTLGCSGRPSDDPTDGGPIDAGTDGGTSGLDAGSCAIACLTSGDCPTGQTCNEQGLCTTGESCPCSPGAFFSCIDPTTMRACAASGVGLENVSCGTAGCNADARRCNTCVPGSVWCDGMNQKLQRCGSDGTIAQTETCALGCRPATGAASAHCGYIEPRFAPDVCDALATAPAFEVNSPMTLNTSGTDCTSTIAQDGGPDICVIRYGRIVVSSSLRIVGSRPVALAADAELRVTSTGSIDISANGSSAGPGGEMLLSGGSNGSGGNGGAGLVQTGGIGGSSSSSSGGAGGLPVAPTYLVGGPSAIDNVLGGRAPVGYPRGGGGGGGLTLVACRGQVSIEGLIDAGGGGGDGSKSLGPLGISPGRGGGAGGLVVLQGVDVVVTGRVYSNGGGGGEGCNSEPCAGQNGYDGLLEENPAPGGGTTGPRGGRGGSRSSAPSNGGNGTLTGAGGGGSMGRLMVLVPSGRSALVAPTSVSPLFDPAGEIRTR